MKKVIFGLIATLLFVSCENETTNSESNYSKSNLYSKSNTLEQNLNEFSKNHITKAKDLISLISTESKNLLFDENSFNEIIELKTENDVEIYFKSKGVSNTKQFISILKELETNYKSFIENTPSFKSLNNEVKFNLIENSLNFEMDKDVFWSVQDVNLQARISCSKQAAIDRARCERNQAIGLGFSFVGGLLTGGVGGWLGAAASTTAYHFCIEDLQEDFNNCRNN